MSIIERRGDFWILAGILSAAIGVIGASVALYLAPEDTSNEKI